ncbi:MAG TPA: hypothetical protein VIG97_08965 [Luteimonas sp.]
MSRINRDEPSIGSADVSQVEFRRPRRPSLRTDDDHRHAGLWWRIGLGIFAGMLAHSIVTGLYVRWELYTGVRALGAAFEDLGKEQTPRPTPMQGRRHGLSRRRAHGQLPSDHLPLTNDASAASDSNGWRMAEFKC